MIQNMFRKKGLVPAIDWLFTFFNRGEAYFWLEFLEQHLFPELKVSFKWPDRYGGGFVFSSAGWINAAPLQAAKKPEKPKAKRDRNKAAAAAASKTSGKDKGLGMSIKSYGRVKDDSSGNGGAQGVSTSDRADDGAPKTAQNGLFQTY